MNSDTINTPEKDPLSEGPTISLIVTLNEAVAIGQLLGQVPTQYGAFPLYNKIIDQVKPHLPTQEPCTEEPKKSSLKIIK